MYLVECEFSFCIFDFLIFFVRVLCSVGIDRFFDGDVFLDFDDFGGWDEYRGFIYIFYVDYYGGRGGWEFYYKGSFVGYFDI